MKRTKKQMTLRSGRRNRSQFGLTILYCLILGSCNVDNKGVLKGEDIKNVLIDDSTINMYIPVTLFDSMSSGYRKFGFYEYYYGSRNNNRVNIQIRYELEIEGGAPKGNTHEVTTRLITARDHINGRNGKEKVVSIDSVILSDARIGVINYLTGINDSVYYTTLAFVPNHKRPWYEIYINYDNSTLGNRLKDSIPKILESISINPPKR